MPATAEISFGATPNASMKTAMSLTTKRKMKQQTLKLQKRIHTLRSGLKVSDASNNHTDMFSSKQRIGLLAPLTSVAGLPEHPSLSIPYLSPILSDMTQHACEMAQRERKTLRNAKRLLTKLRGDETWIPCGLLNSKVDNSIFDTGHVYKKIVSNVSANGPNGSSGQDTANGSVSGDSLLLTRSGSKTEVELESVSAGANGAHVIEKEAGGVPHSEESTSAATTAAAAPREASGDAHDVSMEDAYDNDEDAGAVNPENSVDADKELEDEVVGIVGPEISITGDHHAQHDPDKIETAAQNGEPTSATDMKGIPSQTEEDTNKPRDPAEAKIEVGQTDGEEAEEENREGSGEAEDETKPEPRRMRTRAQAQAVSEPAASSRTESPDPENLPPIHPLFLIPDSAKPDQDFALPPNEAEETRRMLMMYVQKQEEVCRGAEKLYEGLLKADRQRKTVFKWCRAEGHVGEMSDGEDWYDKEDWGLDEDLGKGQADEEDEGAIQGKKTRGRRN